MTDDPFPTVAKLAQETGSTWPAFKVAAEETAKAEAKLKSVMDFLGKNGSIVDVDSSLVLFGSFARREMLEGSDFDWALLIDGVVNNKHSDQALEVKKAMLAERLIEPGSSGTFGDLMFSHELVHRVGGGVDSNANLTRRMLMLLESRPVSVSNNDNSKQIWENVLKNILKRYFEEDVHFAPTGDRKVPRFLVNDLTRYWRTICVDYAAKHQEQDGKKWAIRNAKLRLSRKLLYASGLAFCLSCQLAPPRIARDLFGESIDESAYPFIKSAMDFARTPPMEYLAGFVDRVITDKEKQIKIAKLVFGSYNSWLELLGNHENRTHLEGLDHANASSSPVFDSVRQFGSDFAKGLELMFFNRDRDDEQDEVAKLSLEYIGF